MKVVRQWMIRTELKVLPIGSLILCTFLNLLSSCNPTELQGKIAKSGVTGGLAALENKAYIYRDSPYILAGTRYSPAGNVDMGLFLDRKRPEYITANSQLTSNCSMNFFFGTVQSEIPNCVRAIKDAENLQLLPRKDDKNWNYAANTPEFYQVNMLHHINVGMDSFFKKLSFAYDRLNSYPQTVPRSLPPYLKDSQMYWFKGVSNIDNQLFRNGYLTALAECDIELNASFSPAGPELCFGKYKDFPKFFFVQDPSIIYHEFGHALVSIMLNMRNATANNAHALRANLGSYGYDEAGSINEGLADYFSYVNNRRTHFGEWALGKTANQSRPISEADAQHIQGVDTTPEGRLSYPMYLHYDSNNPELIVEDVHQAGQITSHYFVALTEALKSKCTFTTTDKHEEATSYVLLVLAESLSEIGDLNAKGIDDYWFGSPFSASVYFNNLDPVNSFLWTQFINLTNHRRLYQKVAKNINKFITGTTTIAGLCPAFSKNDSEKLLDDYGLLLFKTYNDNGNSTKDRSITYSNAVNSIPFQPLTPVNENNRRKSVMVSKQLISMAERNEANPTAVSYYIIDSRSNMESLLKDLLFKGFPIPLSSNVASVEYNNTNIKISPGEIVAIVPNLYNGSNSPMAGAQILATDWDHVHITDQTTGNFKPCVVDSVTTVDDGGESGATCDPVNSVYPDKEYRRLTKNPLTQLFPANAAAPVCMVLLEEGESSRWVSQSEFRNKQGLSLVDKDCLGFQTSGTTDSDFTFNPHECLVRFLPGANSSYFSKIDAQKNYYDSVTKVSDSKNLSAGNILIMEVNKWIPPGTKFRCRLRARFTNCSDCYHDAANGNDDYLDSDYNGHRPFKVLNFDFDIND